MRVLYDSNSSVKSTHNDYFRYFDNWGHLPKFNISTNIWNKMFRQSFLPPKFCIVWYCICVQILEGCIFNVFYSWLSICSIIILEVSLKIIWFVSVGEQDGIGNICTDIWMAIHIFDIWKLWWNALNYSRSVCWLVGAGLAMIFTPYCM